MATWIVHLRLAERLLPLIGGLDETYFAIGNVAPDSGIPDANWENFDPPSEVTHVWDATRRCGDLEFYRRYLALLRQGETSSQRFSFLLGYFFHLLTDNLWRMKIGQPIRQRFAAEFEADPKFIWQVKRDWYGLDFAYVRSERDSLFWRVFLPGDYAGDFLDFLPQEAIARQLGHIKEFYQRTDDKVETWYIQRPGIYLAAEDMDCFVTETTAKLLRAFQHLQQGLDTSSLHSILDGDLLRETGEKHS